MNEWTLDTNTVIDITSDKARRRRLSQLPRWQQSLAGVIILAGFGLLVLSGIGRAVNQTAEPWAVIYLAGLAMTYLAIAFIAWRSGRLV